MDSFLIEYCDKLVEEANLKLLKLRLSQTKGAVHRIRILFKRIQSLNNFISYLLNDSSLDCFSKPAGVFYRKLGKLRDLQIQLNITNSIKNADRREKELLDKLLKQEIKNKSKEIEKFLRTSDDVYVYSISEWYTNITTDESGFSIDSLNCFLRERQLSFKKMGIFEVDDAQLHSFRKKLKDVVYVIDVFKKYDPKIKINSRDIKRVNQLQNLLGYWNDWLRFALNLSKINRKIITFPNFEWIANVEKEKIRKVITEKLYKISNREFSLLEIKR